MFRIRFVTAFVLFWIFYAALSLPESSIPSLTLISLFVAIGGAEFTAIRWHTIDAFNQAELKSPPMHAEHWALGFAYAAGLPIFYLGDELFGLNRNGGFVTLASWVGLWAILGCAVFYRREKNLEVATQKYMNGLAGFIYLTLPALIFFKLSQIKIENAPQGIALYFAFAAVFMGDTGAYIAGRFLGRTKLLPRVSPKKTIEGAIGGLLCSGITGYVLCSYFQFPFSPWWGGFVATIAGCAGQIGDLAESAIKRAANCKDSGRMLPGHGGVLDRIDAVLFGAPITYLLFLNLI